MIPRRANAVGGIRGGDDPLRSGRDSLRRVDAGMGLRIRHEMHVAYLQLRTLSIRIG